VYKSQGVVCFGIGDKDPGTAASCWQFAKDVGWTFPVAVDTDNVFKNYETWVENYFVIGRDGRIVTRIVGTGRNIMPQPWSTVEPRLKAAIESALTAVGVQDETWGRIKALYR